jgi:hypothetical protein
MKKALLFLLFTLLFVTACKKAETTNLGTDDTYLQQVNVSVNNGELGTRSAATAVTRPSLIKQVGSPNRTIEYLCSGNSSVMVRWTTDAANNMTFSSTKPLNVIIGCNSATDQAHHIIPLKATDEANDGIDLHLVLRAAALYGFNPQDAYNGICSPLGIHANHPQYNAWVISQLNFYTSSGRTVDLTNDASCNNANIWVQCKLIPYLRGKINAAIAANTKINDYFRPTAGNVPATFIGY